MFSTADVLVTPGKRSCVVFSTADVLVTSGKRSCVVFPTADVLVTSGKRSCFVLSTRDVLVTSDKRSCVILHVLRACDARHRSGDTGVICNIDQAPAAIDIQQRVVVHKAKNESLTV